MGVDPLRMPQTTPCETTDAKVREKYAVGKAIAEVAVANERSGSQRPAWTADPTKHVPVPVLGKDVWRMIREFAMPKLVTRACKKGCGRVFDVTPVKGARGKFYVPTSLKHHERQCDYIPLLDVVDDKALFAQEAAAAQRDLAALGLPGVDFEALFADVPAGRRAQTLQALLKYDLHEIHAQYRASYNRTAEPIQLLAYLLRSRVPDVLNVALTTACSATALGEVYMDGDLALVARPPLRQARGRGPPAPAPACRRANPRHSPIPLA